MISITLPDGSVRDFVSATTVADVAASIGAGLARAALAGVVNGEFVDTSYLIQQDSTLSLITAKDEAGLEIIRHSTAHLLAQAVKQLYPQVQITIGPVVENGFYYDFVYPQGFSEADMSLIEQRMYELAKQDLQIERSVIERNQAISLFKQMGESYKAEIIGEIPADKEIALYSQGDFKDLCRGPHVPSTGYLKAFKLMKVAGAYWRGDSSNEMLQRIYGTAWPDKKQLKIYLQQLEEADKRDHRKLAKQLGLFHIQDEAPGMVFWHDRGWTLYQIVKQYLRVEQQRRGYTEINTPQVIDYSLWQRSGHAEKFGDNMFAIESEGRQFALKPMNCPCHVQVFNQGLKSYRDLPLRLAEFGSCHRNELSGSLHGLMRVRGFVQDDAHIFCTEAQIHSEVSEFIDFLHDIYADFGFKDIIYRLSTRPDNCVGTDEAWNKAEAALASALDAKQLSWQELAGEGAFYGPKIEFSLKDCIGRVWQCGTIQVDFSMPGRLDAQYIDENGARQTPVMLHRAILGSIERFIGILIEHYEGNFPIWLAPTQVIVLNITDKQGKYARCCEKNLIKYGFRAKSDLRNEKIGYKIREHTLQRIPYLLVVGDREAKSNTVAVRTLDGQDLGVMPIGEFCNILDEDCTQRGNQNLEDR